MDYERRVRQALESPDAHRFLVHLGETLGVFARHGYADGRLELDDTSGRAWLQAFHELDSIVQARLWESVTGVPGLGNADLADAIVGFHLPAGEHSEYVGLIVERALDASGTVCPYCLLWGQFEAATCPDCQAELRTEGAFVMALLRKAQLEFVEPLAGRRGDRAEALRASLEGSPGEPFYLIDAGLDPEGAYWSYVIGDGVFHVATQREAGVELSTIELEGRERAAVGAFIDSLSS